MSNPRHPSAEPPGNAAARHAEQRARGLLEAAPDAMVVVNAGGLIELVNGRTEELFGYQRAELLDQPVEVLVPKRFQSDHVVQRHGYARRPEVRPMGTGLELAGRRKDGSEFPVEISLSPFEIGGETLVSAAIRDVTARQKIERELRAAKNEAEHASQAKSSFLAAASHDLRQPLQAARFYLEVLDSELERKLGESPPTLEKLGRCLANLRSLLNRLLDLSKLDAGGITPALRATPTRKLLDRLRTEMRSLALESGLKLRVAGPSLRVETDPLLLGRILENLLSNAVRYTDRGGVLLAVRRRRGRVAIQVWDTGVGIPADSLEAVFEEFHQVGSSARASSESFGLGLAIVRRLADLLGHEVNVRSELGRGSMFEIVLPLAVDPEDVPAAENKPAGSGKVEGFVVVIEDEPAVLDSLRALLEVTGYRVATATSAEGALVALEEAGRGPDMVISDYRLSETSTGIDALEQVRSRYGREIPGLLLTGDTSLPRLTRIGGKRGFRVLHKPVEPAELSRALESGLAGRRTG